MHWLIVALLLAGALFGPQLWVQAVMRRHSAPRADFPGSGGDLARHLLDRLGLDGVAARRILRAAALAYVAGTLASLLNLWRWLRPGRS